MRNSIGTAHYMMGHLCDLGIQSEVLPHSCVGFNKGNWLSDEDSLQVGGGVLLAGQNTLDGAWSGTLRFGVPPPGLWRGKDSLSNPRGSLGG